jgi:hypothetical protein
MTSFFSSVQPISGFELGPHSTVARGCAVYDKEPEESDEACDSALFHGSVLDAIFPFTKSSIALFTRMPGCTSPVGPTIPPPGLPALPPEPPLPLAPPLGAPPPLAPALGAAPPPPNVPPVPADANFPPAPANDDDPEAPKPGEPALPLGEPALAGEVPPLAGEVPPLSSGPEGSPPLPELALHAARVSIEHETRNRSDGGERMVGWSPMPRACRAHASLRRWRFRALTHSRRSDETQAITQTGDSRKLRSSRRRVLSDAHFAQRVSELCPNPETSWTHAARARPVALAKCREIGRSSRVSVKRCDFANAAPCFSPRRAMPLTEFHPAVRTWFAARLGEPTPPQRDGWPAIRAGKHT